MQIMPAIALLMSAVAAGEAALPVDAPAFFAGNDELHACLMEAAERHPGLRALHAEWLAGLERIPQATSLDDPMLSYTQVFQSEMERARVMLSQRFPWFGTLRTQGAQAAAEADAAIARFYDARNRVIAAVKQAYFEYAFLAENLRVTESQAEVIGYMEDIVRVKLALGLANDDELLRVSIEKAKLDDRYAELQQMRPALMASLNEALGRPVFEERPWPSPAEFAPSAPPAAIVLARVRVANPDLAAYTHMIESRRLQGELARKKGRPDFTLGVEYVFAKGKEMRESDGGGSYAGMSSLTGGMGGTGMPTVQPSGGGMPEFKDREDSIMVSLGVNVPIWRKRVRAGVAEARLLEEAVGYEKERRALELEAAARMALFRIEDAERRYRLYEETLTPQARQAFESLQDRYAVAFAPGSAGAEFLDVLGAVQTLLDFELEQVRAARDRHLGAAELEYLMGGPWAAEEGGGEELESSG